MDQLGPSSDQKADVDQLGPSSDQKADVKPISAINFDLRGRLDGVLAAFSTTSPHECVFATRAEEGIKKATGTP